MIEQITEIVPTRQPKTKRSTQLGKPKSDILRKLLVRKQGATVAQLQKQFGWQPHTVRAAISRMRSSGLSVELDRSGKVARYRALPGGGQ